jgi:hypothetical protein
MDEQKTRDQIDIELSRTYFGNAEDRTSPHTQDTTKQEKARQEEARQEKAQRMSPHTGRHWSGLTILFILWIISSIIFAAGYLLRGKRVVFHVNINVEPAASSKKQVSTPGILRDISARIKQASGARTIQASLPGKMRPSSETITVSPPKTIEELISRIRQALSFKAPQPKADLANVPKPKLRTSDIKPAAQKIKTLYNFEFTEEGWEIPAWATEKVDHVARSLKKTDVAASKGNSALELIAEFPGGQWTAALVEVQQYLDLTNYSGIQANVFVPADCPEGLRCRFILTVGENWRFVEMSRSVRLVPGEWTTVSASISEGSTDWKRMTVDNAFKADVRKVALRIESNRKPAYTGPIYIDNISITSAQ